MSRTLTKNPATHRSHTFYVVLQHGGSSFSSGVRLPVEYHVDNTTNIILEDHYSQQSVVFQPIARSLTENATLEQVSAIWHT